jgi:predicted RND superfamily exporter protein
MIFLAQIPLLSGFIITLGIMGYANIGFNYINISAIALMLGIGIDYGVYVMQASLESRDLLDKGIIRHAFKNTVICALTTIAGFGSLVTTNFRGIASLGLVISIGVISCLITSTALLPIAEIFLKKRNEGL